MLKKNSLLFLMIFLIFYGFQSCVPKETESLNEYFINNQSSYDLRYNIEIDENLIDIHITSGNTQKIYSEVLRGGPHPPNFYFESTSKYIGSDINLKRDSLNIEVDALKLNKNYDWIEKINGNDFIFELIISDEMLN